MSNVLLSSSVRNVKLILPLTLRIPFNAALHALVRASVTDPRSLLIDELEAIRAHTSVYETSIPRNAAKLICKASKDRLLHIASACCSRISVSYFQDYVLNNSESIGDPPDSRMLDDPKFITDTLIEGFGRNGSVAYGHARMPIQTWLSLPDVAAAIMVWAKLITPPAHHAEAKEQNTLPEPLRKLVKKAAKLGLTAVLVKSEDGYCLNIKE